jgi:hypothetical protein
MTIDSDDTVSLPSPPPPRPAARRDAIDAALRKFDGVEEAPAERAARGGPSRISWATMHRRPAGALVTAALIAIVFIPAVPFILRDSPPEVAPPVEVPSQVPPGPDASSCTGSDCAGQAASEPAQAMSDEAVVAEPVSPAQRLPEPPTDIANRQEVGATASDRKAAFEAPAPLVAAPAPPPPPPPPPSEPEAERDQNIVVTGSRVQAPKAATQGRAEKMGYLAEPASPLAIVDPYGEFLSHLQAGLMSNSRQAVIRLIAFPLRVNLDGKTQTYRSSRDVERDFDRIFTPQVRSAVLNLRSDNLMTRDGGRLKGNGRLWFGCGKKSCAPNAPIRIREVHP